MFCLWNKKTLENNVDELNREEEILMSAITRFSAYINEWNEKLKWKENRYAVVQMQKKQILDFESFRIKEFGPTNESKFSMQDLVEQSVNVTLIKKDMVILIDERLCFVKTVTYPKPNDGPYKVAMVYHIDLNTMSNKSTIVRNCVYVLKSKIVLTQLTFMSEQQIRCKDDANVEYTIEYFTEPQADFITRKLKENGDVKLKLVCYIGKCRILAYY